MTAVPVEVTEAVLEELEALTLSEDVTLERSYADWEAELSDLQAGLRLDVVLADWRTDLATRAKHRHECAVSLLLRRRFTSRDDRVIANGGRLHNESVDTLLEDLQSIAEFFAPSQPTYDGRKLSSVPDAAWLPESTILTPERRSGVTAPYSRDMLADNSQYSGLVTVVYGVHRAIS